MRLVYPTSVAVRLHLLFASLDQSCETKSEMESMDLRLGSRPPFAIEHEYKCLCQTRARGGTQTVLVIMVNLIRTLGKITPKPWQQVGGGMDHCPTH